MRGSPIAREDRTAASFRRRTEERGWDDRARGIHRAGRGDRRARDGPPAPARPRARTRAASGGVGGARRRGALRADRRRRRGGRTAPATRPTRGLAAVRRARDRRRPRRLPRPRRPRRSGNAAPCAPRPASSPSSSARLPLGAALAAPVVGARRAARSPRRRASRTTTSSALHPQLVATVADLLGASPRQRARRRRQRRRAAARRAHRPAEPPCLPRGARHRALRRARRRRPVSLVLLDVDGLGTLVDERGRAPGDARCASSRTPPSAIAGADAFRIGGDEFALLLRSGSDEAARVGRGRRGRAGAGDRRLASVSAGSRRSRPTRARRTSSSTRRISRSTPRSASAAPAVVASRSELDGAAARSSARCTAPSCTG